MRTISPTATPLPTAYDCVAVYIAGRRTNLVVYGCRLRPTTKNMDGGRVATCPGGVLSENLLLLLLECTFFMDNKNMIKKSLFQCIQVLSGSR